MWKEICRFEIRYHLKQPLFYISATILCLLALMLVSTAASEVFADAPRNAMRDAPIVIVRYLTLFSIIGLFVITAFVASAVLRDFEQGTHMLFFTKPVRKFDYLMGRFTGSMAISLALFLLIARLFAGRTVRRVYSEAPPGDGFEPVNVELEDVYFLTLKRARYAGASLQ